MLAPRQAQHGHTGRPLDYTSTLKVAVGRCSVQKGRRASTREASTPELADMQASSFLGASLAPRQASGNSMQQRGTLQTVCVATPSRPPTSNKPKRSKVELIKEGSDFLRHPLMQVTF